MATQHPAEEKFMEFVAELEKQDLVALIKDMIDAQEISIAYIMELLQRNKISIY